MGSNTATKKTTTSAPEGAQESTTESARQRSIFVSAVIDMSWQLAIVVLLPLFIGVKLDSRLHTSPLWVAAGFVMAMFGMFVVLRRMLRQLDQHFINPRGKK